MVIKEPEKVIYGTFKKLTIKEKKGQQLFLIKGFNYDDSQQYSIVKNASFDYYNHLKKENFSNAFSIIGGLLLKHEINSIKLKKNIVLVSLINSGTIKIDLTSSELENYQRELIDLITSTYNKDRARNVNETLDNNKSIIKISGNNYRSFYDKSNNSIAIGIIVTDRGVDFNLSEKEFFIDILKRAIGRNEASIEQISIKDQVIDNTYTHEFINIESRGTNIVLEVLPFEYNKLAYSIVNENNIKNTDANSKQYKKELNKNGY